MDSSRSISARSKGLCFGSVGLWRHRPRNRSNCQGLRHDRSRSDSLWGQAASKSFRPTRPRRPRGYLAGSGLRCRPGKRVSVGVGLPGLGFTTYASKRGHDRRSGAEDSTSKRFHSEPGARTHYSGKTNDPSTPRTLDRWRCFRHSLRLSSSGRSSLVEVSQRDPDAAHFRGRQEP